MSQTYSDAGWSGTPDILAAAVETYGWQISNGIAALIDPAKQGAVLAMVAGPTLDGVAYVLVRSSAALPVPSGVTVVGPDHTSAIAGVFMGDGTEKPTTIPYAAFDARWTDAWKNDLATVAYRLDPARVASIPLALSVALVRGISLGAGNGDINLIGDVTIAWMGACVMAGILTPAQRDTILTP